VRANRHRSIANPVPTAPDLVVLCIDDSATYRQLIVKAMRNQPHMTVAQAGEGEEGIQLATGRMPVLILLDSNLPDMTGADVLRRLKAIPATRPIPVVVLTGETRDEIHAEMRAAGAAECLVKPIDLDRLYELVDRYARRPLHGYRGLMAPSVAGRPARSSPCGSALAATGAWSTGRAA
jgi:two-component system, chemotaxis family, chemotaxis protein CheY